MKRPVFCLKPEHLKLMKQMNVGWDGAEFGAPEIDPKRPYGNSSVYQDMLEILGVKELKAGIYEFELFGQKWLLKGEDRFNLYLDGKDEETLLKALRQLHQEMRISLQVCLSTLSFDLGNYIETDFYSSDFEKVKGTGD